MQEVAKIHRLSELFDLYYRPDLFRFPKLSDKVSEKEYTNIMYSRIGSYSLQKTIYVNEGTHSFLSSLTFFNLQAGTMETMNDNVTYLRCLCVFDWLLKKMRGVKTVVVLGRGKIGRRVFMHCREMGINVRFGDTRNEGSIEADLIVSATSQIHPLYVSTSSRYCISFDGGYSVDAERYQHHFADFPAQLNAVYSEEFPVSQKTEFLAVPEHIPDNSFLYPYGFALFDLIVFLYERNLIES